MNAPVPLFALYGEEAPLHDLDAVHVEPIVARSRLHDWDIRPHRHADLHQVMWVTQGGGVLLLDGREEAFAAPRLMGLPPGAVHGFSWRPGSDGSVLMVAAEVLHALTPAENRGLFESPFSVTPSDDLIAPLQNAFANLQAEFDRNGAGRRAGVHGGVLAVVSLIARCAEQARRAAAPVSPEAALADRFRRLVERDCRSHAELATYAQALGVTVSRLTRACRMATGRSPLELIHERLMLEARRSLTYTCASVAETAYALGFSDPAYFSRFFRRREGVSPDRFRRARLAV